MPTGDEGSGGEEARRRRAGALRALAQGAATEPESAPHEEPTPALATVALKSSPTRRRPRWLIPAISGVALLAVVAVVAAHLLPAPAPRTRQAPAELALDPETYGIACPQDAAWSPDSTKVAILGTQQNCSMPIPQQYTYFPTVVVIVDAMTGKSLGQLTPDVTVQRDLHLRAPQYITPESGLANSGDLTRQGVQYLRIAWSPDGKSIALPFFLNYATKPFTGSPVAGGVVAVQGLYIGAIDGSSAHAVAVDQADDARFSGEWNVSTGKPILLPTTPSANTVQSASPQLLPASLSYSWRSDGTLAGAGALNTVNPPARPALRPIGNPDGRASFTIWQPMSVQSYAGDPAKPEKVASFVAQTWFVVWSPDGTFLLSASFGWRLLPSKRPVPSPSQLKVEGAANLPVLPIRDAALDAMLNPIPGKPGSITSGDFAWSPNGKMLAAHDNGGVEETDTYLILDCASAKTLATIKVSGASNASGNITWAPGMMWSPDGKRLLVGSGAELFILGPGKLPQE